MKWFRIGILLALALFGLRATSVATQELETQVMEEFLDACVSPESVDTASLTYPTTVGGERYPGVWLNQSHLYPELLVDLFVFSPDCTRAAISFFDDDVRIVELSGGLNTIATLLPTGDIRQGRLIWIDNQRLCTSGMYDIQCWNADTGEQYLVIEHTQNRQEIEDIAYASDWIFHATVGEYADSEKLVTGLLATNLTTETFVSLPLELLGEPDSIAAIAQEDGTFRIGLVTLEGSLWVEKFDPEQLEYFYQASYMVPELSDGDRNPSDLRWITSERLMVASTLVVLDGFDAIIIPEADSYHEEFGIFDDQHD